MNTRNTLPPAERNDIHTMPNDDTHACDSGCWCFPTMLDPHSGKIVDERSSPRMIWVHHNVPRC